MKKITKVLGLLVVAAMLFVGCSPSTGNNNDNGGNNGNDSKDSVDDGVNDSSSKTVDFDTPLFDENSLTEDVDAIELSDGIWIYRRIDTDYYLNSSNFHIKMDRLIIVRMEHLIFISVGLLLFQMMQMKN